MSVSRDILRLGTPESAAHHALVLLAPELAPLVRAVGVRGAMSVMLVLGGRRVRIPRVEDALKVLEIVPAVVEVLAGGATPEEAGRRAGISPARVRTVAEAVARQELEMRAAAIEREPAK